MSFSSTPYCTDCFKYDIKYSHHQSETGTLINMYGYLHRNHNINYNFIFIFKIKIFLKKNVILQFIYHMIYLQSFFFLDNFSAETNPYLCFLLTLNKKIHE